MFPWTLDALIPVRWSREVLDYQCYVILHADAREGKTVKWSYGETNNESEILTRAMIGLANGSSGSITKAFMDDISALVNCFISKRISLRHRWPWKPVSKVMQAFSLRQTRSHLCPLRFQLHGACCISECWFELFQSCQCFGSPVERKMMFGI